MARKTTIYVGTDDRDKGKQYLITEMTASKGEAWSMRALLAIMAGNAELPEGFEQLGAAGLAEMGFKSLTSLRWEVLEPLLSEMFESVEIKMPAAVRPLMEEDIEEISTRLKLRMEIWKLNLGFLTAVAPSLFTRLKGMTPAIAKSSVTKTSAK